MTFLYPHLLWGCPYSCSSTYYGAASRRLRCSYPPYVG